MPDASWSKPPRRVIVDERTLWDVLGELEADLLRRGVLQSTDVGQPTSPPSEGKP
jgi:hypothetical protein